MEKNAIIKATKNEKGFISLELDVNGINASIKINDFGGSQKKTARLLTYKLYKSLGGK